MATKAIKDIPYKIYLSENEIPSSWYNLRADMKNKPAPLLNPGTLKPMTAEELEGVFCKELVKQELDNDTRFVEIPKEIRDFYKMYRPSPVVRAYCLEEALGTPAHIYYKFEGNTGLLCQAAGPEGCDHRDRSRSVGHGSLDELRISWTGPQGLHGQGQLRAEAWPP